MCVRERERKREREKERKRGRALERGSGKDREVARDLFDDHLPAVTSRFYRVHLFINAALRENRHPCHLARPTTPTLTFHSIFLPMSPARLFPHRRIGEKETKRGGKKNILQKKKTLAGGPWRSVT
jgi:hypothetical protein